MEDSPLFLGGVHVNTLHQEYCFSFKGDFFTILKQAVFVQSLLTENRNSNLQLNEDTEMVLLDVFGWSFESLALSLARVWDQDKNDVSLISLRNLTFHFQDRNYLGCRCLMEGNDARSLFDALEANPIRSRLRVARTELLAHTIIPGHSKDRKWSDLSGKREYELVNGEVIRFALQTAELLFKLLCELNVGHWHKGKTFEEIKSAYLLNCQQFQDRLSPSCPPAT
ncbi:MAG: hypothetical protein ACK4RZ_01585 [Paracoccaceae bacterium]